MTPKEYVKYNALKAVSEFGREMTPEEHKQGRKASLHWVREIIQGHKVIADYGAGSGWLKEMAEEMGMQCIEIDEISQKGSFAKIPVVDLVVSITVLEHMTPEEIMEFFDTCARKTQRLFLVTNNPKCAFSHFVLWDDITHVRMYSDTAIAALLGAKGWTIERQFYQCDIFWNADFWQRLCLKILRRGLGPMFLSSTHNYWCILAKRPAMAP
jgi:hypothetical protein